jgi:integrase
LQEQEMIISVLRDHYKPYFQLAFASGLRQGEQFGMKVGDIDWENGILSIKRAMTRDLQEKRVEGRCKNKYSRRNISILPDMMEALLAQKTIYEKNKSKYLFCTINGCQLDSTNLREDVWVPALKKQD